MKDLAKATSDVRKVFVEEVTWTALVGWVQTHQEERQLGGRVGNKATAVVFGELGSPTYLSGEEMFAEG